MTTPQLMRRGATTREIAAAVAEGSLLRARRGVYATPSATAEEVLAASLCGRLTGMSAIRAMGGWSWRDDGIVHIAVPPTTSRLRAIPPQVRLHWQEPTGIGGDATISRVSTADALVRAVLDADVETAVAAVDWALATGRIDGFQFEQIILALPQTSRSIGVWVDTRSQSVIESVARVRLLRRGWRVRSQTRVGDLESIDLVVEEVVALELDGREFHESTFERDRRKDLQITVEGRHSIRVSALMVLEIWPRIELAIEAALRAAQSAPVVSTGVVAPQPRGRRRSSTLRRHRLLSKPRHRS